MILFYYMNGCGFCDKAKNLLAPQIQSGEVKVLSKDQVPSNVQARGFPLFTNENGTVKHEGLPSSFQELQKKLGGSSGPPMPRPMPGPAPMPRPMPGPAPMPRPMPSHGAENGMILFFYMNGCGHCENMKNMLGDLIASGLVSLLPASQAPQGVQGFPHFESRVTGQSHTGGTSNVKELFDKLGHTQSSRPMPAPSPRPVGPAPSPRPVGPAPSPHSPTPAPKPMPEPMPMPKPSVKAGPNVWWRAGVF
jgi:glutaredoxin